jgi:hypothetical protein
VNEEELRKAQETGEELEYHCTGGEHGASLLPGPGWYPCRVEKMYASGNVEIALTGEEDGLYVTVLKRNCSLAFRRRGSVTR